MVYDCGNSWASSIIIFIDLLFNIIHKLNKNRILHESSLHMKCMKQSFMNSIWNDHECKILFIIWLIWMGFYRLENLTFFSIKYDIVTDGIMTLRASNQVL